MASRKQKKATGEVATASAATATEQKNDPEVSAAKKRTAKKAAVRRVAKPKRRGPGGPKGSKSKPRAATKAAKKSARPRRYTPAERAKILTAAKREGLSGPAAAKKFGISQLTFYTWRKKAGASKPRGGRGSRAAAVGAAAGRTLANALNIADVLRAEIRAQIRRLIPDVVAAELGGQTKRRRGRPAKA